MAKQHVITSRGQAFSIDEAGTIRTMSLPGFAALLLPPEERDRQVTARTAYTNVAPVYQAVELRSKALSIIPYTLERDGVEVFDSDPQARDKQGKRLQLPAEFAFLRSLPTLFRLSEAALCCVGKVRIHKTRKQGGQRTTGLRWYDPRTITVPQDETHYEYKTIDGKRLPTGRILKYRRDTGNHVADIPAEEILAINYCDWGVETGAGSPPMTAALAGAKVLYEYTTYVAGQMETGNPGNFFISYHDPSGQGRKPDEAVQPKIKRDIFKMFRQRGAVKKPEDVSVFTEFMKVNTFGEGVGDLNNKEITRAHYEWVASAFGLNTDLLLGDAANYARAMLSEYQLYMHTLFPDAMLLEAALNEQLLNEFSYHLRFQYRRVESIQWAEVQKAQAASLLTGGERVLTAEQAMKLLGLFPEMERESAALSKNGQDKASAELTT